MFQSFSLILANAGIIGLAVTGAPEWAPPLGAGAIITTFLGWLMFKQDKRLEAMQTKLDHLATAGYMGIINSRKADPEMKDDARRQLDRLKKDEAPE